MPKAGNVIKNDDGSLAAQLDPEVMRQQEAWRNADLAKGTQLAVDPYAPDRSHLETMAQQSSQIAGRSPIQLASSVPKFDQNIGGRIERQRQIVRDGQYTPIGQLERIQIEGSGIPLKVVQMDTETSQARQIDNPLTRSKTLSASLDWMKYGPLVGVSTDGKELVVVPPVLHPPPIPDPDWEHPPLHDKDGKYLKGIIKEGDAHIPRIEQTLAFRAWGSCTIGIDKWMVFQPIHQMMLLGRSSNGPAAELWRRGQGAVGGPTGFLIADWYPDALGYSCMLLFSVERRQAHILGGVWQFRNDV